MRSAADGHRVRAFRRWAPLFGVLDHESGPTNVAVMALGSAILIWLAMAEGRAVRHDGGGPTLVAVLAVTVLGAALVLAVAEVLAWLMARPVGRDVARAEASLGSARVAVRRARLTPNACDAALASYVGRMERAADRLERWLADADARVIAWAMLQDPVTRASRLDLMREEGRAIAAAAEALAGVSRLISWIAMCPWSPALPEALARLPRELASAERLLTDQA